MADQENKTRTHRALIPEDVCQLLAYKQLVTHMLDDEVYDDRQDPGDGYFWCQRSCYELGPDGNVVETKSCRKGRSCWEGIEV